MGSDTNRRPWATSHIGGLYFFGADDILHYQSVRCHVKCAPNGGNRPHRPNVRGLTLDALGGAALWRYLGVFQSVSMLFFAWGQQCRALFFPAQGFVFSFPTHNIATP